MDLLNQVIGAALGGQGRAGGHGGASPVVQGVLVAIAAQAAKDYLQPKAGAAGGGLGDMLGGVLGGLGGGQQQGGGPGGGLGDLLAGALGGGGGGLASILGGLGGAGGLAALIEQFQRQGHGATVASWVDMGENQAITPQALAGVLGEGNVQELIARTGLSQTDLLAQLSQILPGAIDHLTPAGRLPTDDELPGRA